MKALRALLMAIPVLAGCAGLHQQIPEAEISLNSGDLYFDSAPERTARIDKFLAVRKTCSENQKIYFLLDALEKSGLVFVRNRQPFSSSQAKLWLLRKMKLKHFYQDRPYYDAQGFIELIATRSNKSGELYVVILPDGTRVPARALLLNELFYLENQLLERQLNAAPVIAESPVVQSDEKVNASLLGAAATAAA